MSERRENSVLFSLKELRNIEDGRVKKERDEADARVEAERSAKASAERAVREAEERRIRDEEDRVRRVEEEKESRVREDQMRLGEAERRARVEGEVRLQEERLRLEVHAKTQQTSPLKAILGVTGVLVIVAIGLGYKMYSDHQAELTAERAKAAEERAVAQAAKAELEAKFNALQKDTDEKLAKAQTDEQKAQIRAEAAQRRAELQSGRPSHTRTASKPEEKTNVPVLRNVKKREVPDDPLNGL